MASLVELLIIIASNTTFIFNTSMKHKIDFDYHCPKYNIHYFDDHYAKYNIHFNSFSVFEK